MQEFINSFYDSPIGVIEISADDYNLFSLRFFENDVKRPQEKENKIIEKVIRQLDEYFRKQRKVFELPLKPEGTDFQKKVWQALTQVPYGKTSTYKEIAERTGDLKAVRAVGGANRKNPIAIIIPCHRIIGSDNHLTGYAGGLWRKEWLLRHEGALLV
ncbi:MAG: methylated-DNA--[protein]-cysteine S-methyltransferase [Calditrichaceae bacterium]|nr:methylated-DNA--[protein]-cysteine S-methyltransferase [Calditrichaceae bacterium]MBN2710708.1 methylated-DNA--[protein]-cysteine S-methyltransferase [Calditrichaceae bacterium]RQV92737.1 MAG: methylated-DNA--[protein]-cysteine S-methyltransferase [Calditrichota bacterium]